MLSLTSRIEHTDNRDFDVVPNYQPSGGKDLDQQTLMFGLKEDVCSFTILEVGN